jgi:predicted phosphohydrolase
MNVWAISDLHLSFARPERRERYAARWRDHAARIKQLWLEAVAAADLVLLPGDLSMARNHRDLQPDLEWLAQLPGIKVLAPGNHDRWWNSVQAIRPLLRSGQMAVDGDAVSVHGAVVCGTAGAPVPARATKAAEPDAAVRPLDALTRALEHASRLRMRPKTPLYVLWHYPPFDAHGRPGPCVPLFERFGVTACVYGHLHNQSEWPAAMQGAFQGVRYHCVAADAIGFRPLKIFGKEGIASWQEPTK